MCLCEYFDSTKKGQSIAALALTRVTKPLLLLSLFGLSHLSPVNGYVSWSLNSQTYLPVGSVYAHDFDDNVVADQDVFIFVSGQN